MMKLYPRLCLCSAILLGLSGRGVTQFAFYDSLNHLSWTQVAPPVIDDLEACQIIAEGLGYVLGKNTGRIYEYDAARPQRWRQLPSPTPSRLTRFVALARNDIWAVAENVELYKELLYHWDGREWSLAFDRNVYQCSDLYFRSPEEGWLGCLYGEIWHYWRGEWQREKVPVFIHLQQFVPARDGTLYAICRAPQQVAVLRRGTQGWELVTTNFSSLPVAFFTPAQRLLMRTKDFADRFAVGNLTAWRVPFSSAAFFADGKGYGFEGNTIFALQETSYVAVARMPLPLSDVSLHSRTFSWMVGQDGFLLMSSPQPSNTLKPVAALSSFSMPVELPVRRVYGMAVLQEWPGRPRWIYTVATNAPNVAIALEDFFSNAAFQRGPYSDRAPDLNLAGPLNYDTPNSPGLPALTNYDQGVATGDLNGDGRDDVIVTSMYGHPFVYLKSRKDFYHDATSYSGLHRWGNVRQRPMFPQLFDADNDGDLDLFIACQYASNAFFLNDGFARFTEVTAAAGLTTNGGGIGGYAADFDGDGWQDLYVTCVSRPNLLYRNRGPDEHGRPRFEDVSSVSGDACWQELKESQGAALADYDNDGDIDFFVCNRLSKNRLLQNNGGGFFKDVTDSAGLADSDQSMGAIFYDANLDGHLDLLVSNVGRNRFYLANGDGSFSDFPNSIFNLDVPLNLMDASQRLGGYSSGSLTIDLNHDGALETLVANYDTDLILFPNRQWPNRAVISIAVEGILSNRSAVGTRICLYETPAPGEQAVLVGQRLIEAGSGYACSPAKIAHFGVASDKSYFARIYFPSGIVRELHGLRHGNFFVTELSGLGANYLKTKKTLTDLLFGFRSREHYLIMLLSGAVLLLLIALGQRVFGLSVSDTPRLAVLFVFVFWTCLLLWFARSAFTLVLRPLLMSTVVTLLAMALLRFHRMSRARPASLEMLQVRLHAFDHGSIIHHLMNRLAFYLENLQSGSVLTPTTREKLLQLVHNSQSLLKHEVEGILTCQYATNFAVDRARVLEKNWKQLRKALHSFWKNLQMNQNPKPEVLTTIRSCQEQMRANIRRLQRRLGTEYYSDVPQVISELIQERENLGLQLCVPAPVPRARIVIADLVYVLDELVCNSLRHLDGRPPQIVFELRHAYDEVHLDVRDNGAGIPRHLWEEIFKPGFTTKAEGQGGFGLYHIRQRLEKVGGKIFVAQSQAGGGTTMRLCLKAEI